MDNKRKPQSICWDCAKACGKCSWSTPPSYKPIPGWKAIRNDIKCKGKTVTTVESYIVEECPEFVPDATGHGAYRCR